MSSLSPGKWFCHVIGSMCRLFWLTYPPVWIERVVIEQEIDQETLFCVRLYPDEMSIVTSTPAHKSGILMGRLKLRSNLDSYPEKDPPCWRSSCVTSERRLQVLAWTKLSVALPYICFSKRTDLIFKAIAVFPKSYVAVRTKSWNQNTIIRSPKFPAHGAKIPWFNRKEKTLTLGVRWCCQTHHRTWVTERFSTCQKTILFSTI